MASTGINLIEQDAKLAWRRFRGNATAQEMLRWINHEFRRGYRLQDFEESIAKLKSRGETLDTKSAA
ncbi:MAG TPA: hypothetical protein VFA89_16370 [Terriglobales bacterium]|nr:hypothetical protein [Terriglobales bacterium]